MARKRQGTPEVSKGQVWQLKNACIHIVDMGRWLMHYRMMDSWGEHGARIQTSGIDVMVRYLKTRRARLLFKSVEA
jgi:hypothetical protein